MNWEIIIADGLKILLPGGLILAAGYFAFRGLVQQWTLRERTEQRLTAFEHILPLRVSAYERLTLFMERIQPTGLIARCQPNTQNVGQLKIALLREISEEFEHNVVMQIYLSDTAWKMIMLAKNEIVELIVSSANELSPQASGLLLAERITNRLKENGLEYSQQAFATLRDDLFRLFPNR
jgi:hypothetical protein